MSRFSAQLILCLLVGSVFAACNRPQPAVQQAYPQDRFLSRQGNTADGSFRYRVYVPDNLSADSPPAVMLYLHGAGNRGDDNELQLNGLADQIEVNKEKIRVIIVIPQCPADRFWDEQLIERAKQALDNTVTEFNADPNRLYLAGFSLGGYGVWTMAAMYPGKSAAIVPMAGRVLPRANEMKNISPEIADLAKADDPYKAFAQRIGNTATWIFHGSGDTLVPLESSRKMFAALRSAGSTAVRFDEVAGAGHEPLAFGTEGFFEWLQQQRLNGK